MSTTVPRNQAASRFIRRRGWAIGAFFLLAFLRVLPSGEGIETLAARLPSLPDAQKVPVLLEIASRCVDSDPGQAAGYSRQALELATRLGSKPDQAAALYQLGASLAKLNQLDQAADCLRRCDELYRTIRLVPAEEPQRLRIQLARGDCLELLGRTESRQEDSRHAQASFQAALEIFQELKQPRRVMDVSMKLAVAALMLGNHPDALTAILRAVTIAEQLNDQKNLGTGLYYLAYIHRNLKNWDKAREYFTRCAGLAEANGQVSLEANALNEIGNIEALQERFGEALGHKEKALRLAKKAGDEYTVAACLNDLGCLYQLLKKHRRAMSYFQEANRLNRKLGRLREEGAAWLNMGTIELDLGNAPAAVNHLERALELAQKAELNDDLITIHKSLATALSRTGDYPRAFEHAQAAYYLRETVYNKENARSFNELQTRYEVTQKEQQIALLTKDRTIQDLALKKQRQAQFMLLAGVALLLALLALVFGLYRLKVKTNRLIEGKNRELAEAYRQLDLTSRTDPLTGIWNRREFMERMGVETARSRRTGQPLSVVIADIDNFKSINDRYGHGCGDAVLAGVARLLAARIRKLDTLTRWGGEEFTLLLPETGREGAGILAEKLRSAVAETVIPHDGQSLRVTMTFGLAEFNGRSSIDECLTRADQALYRGKQNGKNQVVLAEEG